MNAAHGIDNFVGKYKLPKPIEAWTGNLKTTIISEENEKIICWKILGPCSLIGKLFFFFKRDHMISMIYKPKEKEVKPPNSFQEAQS